MRFFIFIAGFLLFIGSLFWTKNALAEYEVARNGELVEMEITSLPQSCIGSKIPYNFGLIYKGVSYQRTTRGDFCETHSVGETIKMKMLEGSEIVLFPGETGLFNLMSCLTLGLFGIGCCIGALKSEVV